MDKESKEWLERARKDSGEKIRGSAVFTGLISKHAFDDPMVALQVGYAVMLGKPILLIVDGALELPAKLVRAADAIERVNFDDMAGAQKRIQEALTKILPKAAP